MTSKKTVCVFVLMLIQIGITIIGKMALYIYGISIGYLGIVNCIPDILSLLPSAMFTLFILILMMRIDGINKHPPA